MVEKVKQSRLEWHMDRLDQQLADAMDSGSLRKAADLATATFALFKGQEASDKSQQKRKLTEMMKETTEENVQTYNKKWKMAAGITSGLIQIGAGFMGVGGTAVGALASGSAAALGKGAAGVAQTFSYAGNGTDSVANALFSPTEGKRVEFNAREQMQRTERDDLKNGEDSAKQAKSQAWENNKERRRSEEGAKTAVLRA